MKPGDLFQIKDDEVRWAFYKYVPGETKVNFNLIKDIPKIKRGDVMFFIGHVKPIEDFFGLNLNLSFLIGKTVYLLPKAVLIEFIRTKQILKLNKWRLLK